VRSRPQWRRYAPARSPGKAVAAARWVSETLIIYDRTPVQAGVVFAVEPAFGGGEELGVGAWAERMVVVRESDNEILSAFRWSMEA
jgi:Xaa-Pro aminopeptidase